MTDVTCAFCGQPIDTATAADLAAVMEAFRAAGVQVSETAGPMHEQCMRVAYAMDPEHTTMLRVEKE